VATNLNESATSENFLPAFAQQLQKKSPTPTQTSILSTTLQGKFENKFKNVFLTIDFKLIF
jgi:hypothetical protein